MNLIVYKIKYKLFSFLGIQIDCIGRRYWKNWTFYHNKSAAKQLEK